MPPFIIFEGKLCSPDNIFISGEQELLIKINGGVHRSVDYFLLLYFVCYVEYPKECVNVYLFLQKYILKVYDSARLPTKLLQFLNVLNCKGFIFFVSLVSLRLQIIKVRTREPHRIQMSS